MISKVQARRILLFVLVAIVVLAAAAAAAILATGAQHGAHGDDDEIVLFSAECSDVTAFSFTNHGNSVSLSRKKGEWQSDAQPELPLSQDYVDSIVEFFCNITASRILDSAEDAYGLADPHVSISIKAGKKTCTLLVGAQNPQTFDFYARVEETGQVCMISSLYVSALSVTTEELSLVESLPSLISSDVIEMSVVRGSTKLTVSYSETPLAAYDYSGEKHWLASETKGTYAATTSEAVDFIDAFLAIDFAYIAQQNATATDLAAYDLDDPYMRVTLDYILSDTGEREQYVLLIGTVTPNGYTPVIRVGSNTIYFVLSEYVQTLDSYLDEKLYKPDVYSVLLQEVQQLNITCDGKTLRLVTVAMEVKQEDGSIQVDYDFRGNNAAYDSAAVKTFYNTLLALDYQAQAPDFIPDSDAVLRIELTLDNSHFGKVVFSVYRYDQSFYATVINGETPLLVNKRGIEEVLNLLRMFM